MTAQDANSLIEQTLHDRLEDIEKVRDSDAVAYTGPLLYGVEDIIKYAIEEIPQPKDKLSVLLETTGGYIEVTERIANLFRHHYKTVEFIVPNFAMSAGTILVMSGDAIYMDYFSVLGPIDPQVQRPGSTQLIPALGYLEQYERLIKKSSQGKLTTAELTFLVENFDPAELYRYEQERKLSFTLLKGWLVKFKFQNWTVTTTRKIPVTAAMRTRRAHEIAKRLNQTQRWGTHGRGINMDVVRRELKLQIDDFGADPKLGPAVKAFSRLLRDYMMRRGHTMALERVGNYEGE